MGPCELANLGPHELVNLGSLKFKSHTSKFAQRSHIQVISSRDRSVPKLYTSEDRNAKLSQFRDSAF